MIYAALSLALFVAWPRFARFTFRMFLWPMLWRISNIRGDNRQFKSTRASVLACHQLKWHDAVALAGAFTSATVFLIVTKRARQFDRLALGIMGGAIAVCDTEAGEQISRLIRTGYNVAVFSDDLTVADSDLCRIIVADALKKNLCVVPVALISLGTTKVRSFKCGVPFSKTRALSAEKLAQEIKLLSSEAISSR
jgi:hypothetical protein